MKHFDVSETIMRRALEHLADAIKMADKLPSDEHKDKRLVDAKAFLARWK